jgi:hypothetical protein
MRWFFGVKDKDTIDEIVKEFRRQAKPLVQDSDLVSLSNLYAKCVATARMENPSRQMQAMEAMRGALREELLEPSSRIKRGWFDDLLPTF